MDGRSTGSPGCNYQQNYLAINPPYQPTHRPDQHQWEEEEIFYSWNTNCVPGQLCQPNTAGIRVDRSPLVRALGVHHLWGYIPASITKLTPHLCIELISPDLAAEKLISVITRELPLLCLPMMSLLLQVKRMPTAIIKPRLTYPCYAHGRP